MQGRGDGKMRTGGAGAAAAALSTSGARATSGLLENNQRPKHTFGGPLGVLKALAALRSRWSAPSWRQGAAEAATHTPQSVVDVQRQGRGAAKPFAGRSTTGGARAKPHTPKGLRSESWRFPVVR